MIIHSPIISGSLTFSDGSTLTLPPGSVYSGSFSGSYEGDTFSGGVFTGDGSQLTFNGTGIVSGSSQVDFNDVNNTPFSQSESSVTVEKSIIPSSITLDLGSISSPFRDLYLSSASLYIDGQQVISSDTNTLTFTTDEGQSIKILETGGDDITFQTDTGNIELKGTVEIESGKKIVDSAATKILFGDSIGITGSIDLTGTVDGVDLLQLKTDFDTLEGKTLVSGSSQINSLSHLSTTDLSEGTNLYYTDARVKTKLDIEGVISGSSQISLSGFSTTDLSEGTNLYYTDSRVKTKLDVEGVISGSSQVVLSTTDVSEGTNLYYTDARVKTKLDAEGVISGSSQITSLSHLSTTDLSEGTNLYYTDARVKTKLDAEGVTSGSTHILALVSIDEDNMVSNSDTKLPTQQSVKSYVDTEVAALVDSAPGALDTLNELAAALGDDANFSTTISNQIAGKVSQSLEIISGNGLTGGGNLTTNRTLSVGGGDGISVSADAVAVDGTVLRTNGFGVISGSIQVDHDATTNFVSDEHINHTLVSITAGNGLTGGGTIASSRTLSVGGTTDRISVTADAVDIASTYVGQTSITTLGTIGTGTWQGSVISSAYLDADTAHLSGTQTFSGTKTFSAVTTISNSTDSTSTTTGAFKVTGGVGIGGSLNVGGDVVAYASSDERLKENIELISNPIEKVQFLKGVTWNWNDNADELQKSLPNVGVIAQDVEKVLPQLVTDRDNGFKGVDYAKLTGLLIEAIKEQQKQIDDLKSKLG